MKGTLSSSCRAPTIFGFRSRRLSAHLRVACLNWAATNRPSGDQRGEVNPSDPGRVTASWVARSRTRITVFYVPAVSRIDDFAAVRGPVRIPLWLSIFRERVAGVYHPETEMTNASLSDPPRSYRRSSIWLPSGDQRGLDGYQGRSVNCTGLLPSRFTLHRMPSGNVTYARDLPSGEKRDKLSRDASQVGLEADGTAVS